MRKYLKFGALALLAALILWWFGRSLDWAEVRQSVSHSDWRLLAVAAALISVVYLLRAYRWRALLAPLAPASLRELFVATTVGFSAVFILGRAGEVVRPIVLPLRDRRVRPAASFITIMVERIYDMMAVAFLFALNLLWFRPPAGQTTQFAPVRMAGLVLLAAAAFGLVGLMWFRRRSKSAIKGLDRRFTSWSFVPTRVRRAVIGTLEQLAVALSVLADARAFAVTIGWTALLWLAVALANMLVFRAFGLPFGLTQTVFVLGWALVGSLVPTPGGAAGAFHAATAAGLIFLGVAREEAAAVSIILHLVDFAPAVVFGLYYLLRGDINISRLRFLAASEEIEHAVEDESIMPVKKTEPDSLETVTVGE